MESVLRGPFSTGFVSPSSLGVPAQNRKGLGFNMFGKKDSPADSRPPQPRPSKADHVTLLAEDCTFKGVLTSAGSVRIDGKVEGTVCVNSDLIVGPSALLRADIEANTATIAGEVHGNVKTNDLLELSSTARLFGDVISSQLRIDQGARFVGSSTYLDPEAPASPNSPLVPAEAADSAPPPLPQV